MANFIKVKTSASGWSTATKAYVKKNTGWVQPKSIWMKLLSGWTRIWPTSGPFANDYPYIVSTVSGSTHLTSANVRRIGTSVFGRFSTLDWDANGWGTLSFTYFWKYYGVQSAADTTGEGQSSTGTFVSPSQELAITSGLDKKYLSFRIRGTAVSSPTYFGEVESGDSFDGRIYVAKNLPDLLVTGYPDIQVGSRGSALTITPSVGEVLTYSNTWDTASDKSIESSRTLTKWYRKSTLPASISDSRSAGGYYNDTTGATYIGAGLTYTVQTADIGNYIYCNQEVFNSGSDNDFASFKWDSSTITGPGEGFGRKTGYSCFNKVIGAVPVGTAGTVVVTRTASSYVHTVTNTGTWTGTPTSYRYQWYVLIANSSGYSWNLITGATTASYDAVNLAPTSTTVYAINVVVWASNANGESVAGYGLNSANASGSSPITSTAGGISGSNILVNYKEPIINTFTVTAGQNKFTYVSDFIAYDPTYTAVISWTGTATGSLNVTSSASTQTSGYIAPGTYNFVLTVTNTGSYGGSYSKVLTRSNITITAPTAYSFSFGNTMYVGTNGYISFDQGNSTTVIQSTNGKVLGIYPTDLVQGQPTGDVVGLKYWSDSSNYVLQFRSYGYTSPQLTTQVAMDYQVKFNTANSYADVSIIRRGGSLPNSSMPGMYLTGSQWLNGINGLPSYTIPTDTVDEGDTANAYTYRLNFDGTQGSLSIVPWPSRQAGKQYRIPDSLMISAQAINTTNNSAGTTSGSLDDGWTKMISSANQYVLSTITAGTATTTATSLSIPFTTGGADYNTYSYDLRSGSYFGTVIASATGQTANPIVINTGLSSSTTYYLTLTPANSMGQSGNANLTTHSTATGPKAAGTKRIIPLGFTVTSGSTIAYVSTNGFIGLNSDPSSAISIPTTGRYLNIYEADLRQTSLFTNATATTYSIRYLGALLSDVNQKIEYEINFTFGSTAAEVYIIQNTMNNSASDTVLYNNGVAINTWSGTNSSTMISTASTSLTTNDGVDDARTAITLAAPVTVSIPTNATAPTLTGGLNVGSSFTFTVGTWNNTPTSYALYLYRGTQFVATSETLVAGPLNATSSTYTIPLSDYNDANNRKYYRAFASATNSAGTSSVVAGTELGPITNTGGGGGSAPSTPTVSGNNSLAVGGTFSWSSTGATGYAFTVYNPSGTVNYSTYGSYVATTSWRPGYDGTWAGAGNYSIYVYAHNANGDSSVASLTTYMS